jgi:hypothetical protein
MSEIELIQGLKVKVERVISLYEVERSRNEDLTNLVEQYRSKFEDIKVEAYTVWRRL